MTNHLSTIVEAYKHRTRGSIFRLKAAAPFLVPSFSESSEDIGNNISIHSILKETAGNEEEIHIKVWRDEVTRQADEDLLDSYQQVMDDMIQQAIRDIDLGNY